MKRGRKKKVEERPEEKDVVTSVEDNTTNTEHFCQLNETEPQVSSSMTKEQLTQMIKDIDPICGRGGCLHLKSMHMPGNNSQDECHLCSCIHYIA